MRFCADCMTEMGLNPAYSKLALPGYRSHRFVLCDGPQHSEAMITVDTDGRYVPEALRTTSYITTKDVRPGHSLTMSFRRVPAIVAGPISVRFPRY